MAGRHPVLQLGKCEQCLEEDRISLLPTEILVHILSFLDLKEAARTSLLSKSWIGLWVFAAVQLNFDASKVLTELSPIPGVRSLKDLNASVRKETPQYIEWVNKVLQLHQTTVIGRFRICFLLNKSSQDHIDEWLLYAFARKVQSLHLDFRLLGSPDIRIKEPYIFPSCRIIDQNSNESPSIIHDKSIRTLTLTDLESLRSLTLAGVDVSGETLNFFITKFRFLERLVVCNSYSRDLSSVVVCGGLSLKHLELTCCEHLESIIVRDSCLVSLKINGVENLVLENVPMLVDLWVSTSLMNEIAHVLSRLEILTLHADAPYLKQANSRFLGVPQLSSLKQLVPNFPMLEDNSLLHFTFSFLRSSPNLEKVVLQDQKKVRES